MRLLETPVLDVDCLGAVVLFVSGFIGLGVVVVVRDGAVFVKAFLSSKDTRVHTPGAAVIVLTPLLSYR